MADYTQVTEQNRNRESLLSLAKGGSGRVGTYIELVHYSEPEGSCTYIPHIWRDGRGYAESLLLNCESEQGARDLIQICEYDDRKERTEAMAEADAIAKAAPVYDDGRTLNERNPYADRSRN